SGAIQVRISEALCVLPVFTPAAVPGLFVGCLISNTVTGAMLPDIVFGSMATLIGAYGTYILRKSKFIYTLPPVLANAIVVPCVLKLAYQLGDAYWYLALTVGAGEVLSICVLGFILKNALWGYRKQIFRVEE
ncbi:MAG: QueT transporter family protein, partial [Lachnospiraceae bacterium]|nr:QueT transporter family protein [Lachnospiraceae bacterium]